MRLAAQFEGRVHIVVIPTIAREQDTSYNRTNIKRGKQLVARALYRTHRSRSLDEIIGQEHITDLLKQALATGAISHAYLLTGPRGTGKTSIARIIAHEVNGLPYSDEPNLDIIEIDAASNRRIDDIRDLRDKVRIAPVSATYKVYIIDEVHMLTTESFNALLKTLEEPPEHVIFILATTEAHKVPATILSRTQRFHLRPVALEKVMAHLRTIADQEKITIDDDALKLIARYGNGSFRDSIGLLDQLSSAGTPITAASVESSLGLVAQDTIAQLIAAVTHYKTTRVLEILRDLRHTGANPVVTAEQLIRELSETADVQPRIYELLDRLLDVPRAHDPSIKLATVLVQFCESQRPRTAAATVAEPVISAPVAQPPRPQPTPEAPPTPDTAPEVSAPGSTPVAPRPTPTGEFNWDAILAAARTHNAPLHSVLSRARQEYQDGTLTLHFVYALHRKKLEQPQYHSQLSRLIHDVCGISPEIVIRDGKTMDETAATVAEIMGGGEPVNAR